MIAKGQSAYSSKSLFGSVGSAWIEAAFYLRTNGLIDILNVGSNFYAKSRFKLFSMRPVVTNWYDVMLAPGVIYCSLQSQSA